MFMDWRVAGTILLLAPTILSARHYSSTIDHPDLSTYGQNRCGLPAQKWSAQDIDLDYTNDYNLVAVNQAATRLNGRKVTETLLRDKLAAASYRKPRPITVLSFSLNTPCSIVYQMRLIGDHEGQCSSHKLCIEVAEEEWEELQPPYCDADCKAYGRAGGSERSLTLDQQRRLKKNYIDRYGFVPW